MEDQPLDYWTPARKPISGAAAFGGAVTALAAGPGLVLLSMFVAEATSDDPYAGLGGLLVGGIAGAVLMLVALYFGITQSRSPDGRRRGFAMGLLIGFGLSMMAAGACFMVL